MAAFKLVVVGLFENEALSIGGGGGGNAVLIEENEETSEVVGSCDVFEIISP